MINWIRKFSRLSAVSYLIGEITSKGILFLSLPYFTNLLSKQEYGEFSLFISVVPFLSLLIDFSQRTTIKKIYIDYPNQVHNLIVHVYIFSIFSGIFFGVIHYIFSYEIINTKIDSVLFIAVTIFTLNEVYLSYYQIKGSYIKYNIYYIIKNAAPYIVAIFFFLSDPRAIYFVYINIFIGGVILLTFISALLRKIPLKLNAHYFKYSLCIAVPLVPASISSYLLTYSDRVMIDYFFGSASVAEYSMAYNIALILSMFFLAVNKAWQPFIFKKLKEGDIQSLRKIARQYIFLTFTVMCLIILLSDFLIILLSNEEYLESSKLIPQLVLGLFFYFLYTLYSNIAFFYKKMLMFSVPAIVAGILNIILNFILLPVYGYEIAATTTLVAYVVEFFIIYLLCKFYFKIDLIFN